MLWFVYVISCVTSLCMFSYGYNYSTFNIINDYETWNLDFADGSCSNNGSAVVCASVLGTVSTSYTLGSIIAGFFVASLVADRWGRKVAMVLGSFLVIVFSIVEAFTSQFVVHVVARGFVGAGQGVMVPIASVYVGELAPREVRGILLAYGRLFFTFGNLFASIAGLATVNAPWLGSWQWRWVVLGQVIVPTVFVIAVSFCPESPRWLILKGEKDEARKVLRMVRQTDNVHLELEEISYTIEGERGGQLGTFTVLKMIFCDWKIAKRLLMTVFINFGQAATGQNALTNYSSQIYDTIFSTDTVFIINVCSAIMNVLFTFIVTFMVERIGRIKLFVIGAIGMAISMTCASALYLAAPDKTSYYLGVGLVVMLFLFSAFFKPTWGTLAWIYTAEVFPILVRTQAVGIASQAQSAGILLLSQVFPIMFQRWSFNVFFFFGAVNIVLAVVISFFPETRGVKLEDMDSVFDRNSVRKSKIHNGEYDDSDLSVKT
ncbi:hypothetical protein HDU84_003421 [Entophlyctis sp. JEL0112]|nr:hypothetical protein HDU84_003421 [Entophlyctis sp. JEL0112]